MKKSHRKENRIYTTTPGSNLHTVLRDFFWVVSTMLGSIHNNRDEDVSDDIIIASTSFNPGYSK